MPPNAPRKSSSHPQLKPPGDGPNQPESDTWPSLPSALAYFRGLYQAATQSQVLSFSNDGNREESYDDRQSSPSSPTFPGAYPSVKSSTHISSVVEREKDITQPSYLVAPAAPPVVTPAFASTLQNAHDFNIIGTPSFVNIGKKKTVNYYGGTFGLDNLKEFVSFNALHDSSVQDPSRRCHNGTREEVLKQMRNWVEDSTTTKRILWLHGPAGVGKSAIAQTIAHSYGREAVAATFFFYRSDPSRHDGNRLFPTLAWQLAKSIPDFRECVSQALNDDPDIPRKAVEVQFGPLIVQPLQKITATAAHGQTWTPVVIIDGVDECLGEELQERLLRILGNAVTAASHFPLRFLVSSRPEALITETLNQFESTILQIDLAEIEGAYSDIEKYLKAEFARIATKQGIDGDSWPGEDVIGDLTSRSSGQFVYVSTIIKFVGDEYESATSQLEVIMGLQPARDGKSPFAELDALYIEVLRRQHDQKFLKDFLAIFVARSSNGWFSGRDDSLLLRVEERGLRRKLRGMHSLLKIQPGTDIEGHHLSFLDFLHEPARSLQYHCRIEAGTRRYMELIVDSLVRYVSTLMKRPNHHGAEHFEPAFSEAVKYYRRRITMPLADLEEVLKPLLSLQAELFKMPNLTPPWKHGLCDKCKAFRSIDSLLLHLGFYRGPILSSPKAGDGLPYIDLSLLTLEQLDEKSTSRDTDDGLFSLLSVLKEAQFGPSASVRALQFTRALLSSNHAETALKIRSILDAQTLIDFLFYLRSNEEVLGYWGPDGPRNVTLLALEVYARTPLPPQSLFLNEEIVSSGNVSEYNGTPLKRMDYTSADVTLLCQAAFIWGVLSHSNISPLMGIYEDVKASYFTFVYQDTENGTLRNWRQRLNPPAAEIWKRMLEVAKGIRYVHSMGIALVNSIGGDEIIVDSDSHSKVPGLGLSLRCCNEISSDYFSFWGKEDWGYENNIFMFGCIFYEIYFDVDVDYTDRAYCRRHKIVKRPREPDISDVAWELIQRCCAEDAASRPTIDEVIAEMESWT